MANIPTKFADDPFMSAVRDVLESGIRRELKGPLMQIAEEVVDRAVDDAVAGLRVKIEAWMDDYKMQNTLKIVVEKSPPPTLKDTP